MADHLPPPRGAGAGHGSDGAPTPAVLDGDVMSPRVEAPSYDEPPRTEWREPEPARKLRLSMVLAAFASVAVLSSAIAGGGYAVATRLTAGHTVDPTAAALAHLQQDVATLKSGLDNLHTTSDLARQEDSIRSLKKSVDVLKAEIDTGRATSAAAIAQLNTKLDKPDPAAPKLAEIMARIDRLDRDPSPKLAEITARLDRIEKQVSSPAPTGSIAAPTRPPQPAATQAISAPPPADKPVARPAVLDGWVLRDVYDGIALVEGRGGGVREVTPGEFLPGAGEVRSIERRGRAWIVVTSRGIIDNSTW